VVQIGSRAIGAAILMLLSACTIGVRTSPTSHPGSPSSAAATGPVGGLIALDPADGSVRWRITLGRVIDPPQLDAGRLLVAAQPGDVEAVDAATGRVEWAVTLAAKSVRIGAPVIGRGVVVVNISPTPMSAGLVALGETNGHMLWSFHGPGGFLTDPVAIDGQVVVAANNAGQVFALDEVTGEVRWHVRVSNRLLSIAVGDGFLGVLGDDGMLRGLDPIDGHTRWGVGVGDAAFASIAVLANIVYLVEAPTIGAGGSLPTTLLAVDGQTGRMLWSFVKDGLDAFDLNRHLADGDGALYVVTAHPPSRPGFLYAVDTSTGSLRWSYTFGTSAVSPASFVGGTVVLTRTSTDGSKLIGLNPASGRVEWSYPVPGGSLEPVEADGPLAVLGTDQGTAVGFDPMTGIPSWRTIVGAAVDVPPVVFGNLVFVITNRG
jgi:eukaryotic-like serine/threonine-protein kinase